MKLAHTMTAIFLGTAIVLVGFGAMATEGIGADALKVSLVLLLIGVAVGFSGWRVLSRDLRSVRSSLSTLKNDKGKLENELGQEKVQVKKLHENANLLKNDLLELKKINETLNSEKLVLEAQTKHFSVEFSQIKQKMQQLKDQRSDEESRDALAFLTLLQERGRLIDFLMEDITGYSDAQVGAASRIVHQGCRKVLQECFSLTPITQTSEGQRIRLGNLKNELLELAGSTSETVGGDSLVASFYRLIGKVPDDAPSHLEGTLVHRGWVSQRLNLPKIAKQSGNSNRSAHIIVPAEIEV